MKSKRAGTFTITSNIKMKYFINHNRIKQIAGFYLADTTTIAYKSFYSNIINRSLRFHILSAQTGTLSLN